MMTKKEPAMTVQRVRGLPDRAGKKQCGETEEKAVFPEKR